MFGVKNHVRDYLTAIKPWATGSQGLGWTKTDATVKDLEARGVDFVVFPLQTYQITALDRLFLGRKLLKGVLNLNQAVLSFNAAVAAQNHTRGDKELFVAMTHVIHFGTIGNVYGSGLYAAYRALEAQL